MNNTLLISILLCSFVAIHAVIACTSDSECANGCCYTAMGASTGKCYNVSGLGEPCHLPNHHATYMLYPCGCATGLTCDEIHFANTFPDPVHDAEAILLTHGYGLCTDSPGSVFG